jgi:hypothetical protein
MKVTAESRLPLSRARFFLELARTCRSDQRVEFEAFLEASIIFARSAVHRFKTAHELHPKWKELWDSWAKNASVEFFRKERDQILKEAPPKIGQMLFVGTARGGTVGPLTAVPPDQPGSAAEFYYYEAPGIPASVTVERHLVALCALLTNARSILSR